MGTRGPKGPKGSRGQRCDGVFSAVTGGLCGLSVSLSLSVLIFVTLGPGDLRDQSEVADKGEMVSSLWSLGVSVVSRSLRSLGLCGLCGLNFCDLGTRGPKGVKRGRGQRCDGVFSAVSVVSRSLSVSQSLGLSVSRSLCLLGLFPKTKKRPTEAER